MKIGSHNAHLTYCLNVHPGESWQENFAAIRTDACRVRDAVAPGKPFGLGLRLSAQAAKHLDSPATLADLKRFLVAEKLYVFTVNAFPYGTFHAAQVKEEVYRPDWTSPERRDYTLRVARILAELLPEGVTGSVSTVPVAYKGFNLSATAIERAGENLLHVADALAQLAQRKNRVIVLGLEPEPDCLLETCDEVVDFFSGPLTSLASQTANGGANLRRHLGICFDLAHAAVEFEAFIPALQRLRQADVPIAKIQISSALTATGGERSRSALAPFCEPVYLHQTTIRRNDGVIERYRDLDQAMESAACEADEWRVHYHVPLFWQGNAHLGSTSEQIPPAIDYALREGVTANFEIETYTFTVLPPELAPKSLADGIAEEYHWLLKHIFAAVRK